MKFEVVPLASTDTSIRPHQLNLPTFTPLERESKTRKVSLNEEDSAVLEGVGPHASLLWTINEDSIRHLRSRTEIGSPVHKGWDDQVTENPETNSVEVWEIFNFTEDAHPIHIHEVQFQIVNRQRFGRASTRSPESWETGYKDVAIAYRGEITRIRAKFDLTGLYVWRCHIVEHEDNEMMRPLRVGPPS